MSRVQSRHDWYAAFQEQWNAYMSRAAQIDVLILPEAEDMANIAYNDHDEGYFPGRQAAAHELETLFKSIFYGA